MNTTEIEAILRRAPAPQPPALLKQQLKAQALRAPRLSSNPPTTLRPNGSWLTRWWPALAPAAISLACAAVLTVQHTEIQKLKLNPPSPVTRPVDKAPALSPQSRDGSPATSTPVSEQDELSRLTALAANLRREIAQLDQARADNEKLRAQLAAGSGAVLTAEETQALEQARDRALSIQCVNNLKQLGLAARVWALDNGDINPPNFLSMSNELGSFKILVCPADTGRQAAKDPSSFTPANCSYDFLAPSSPVTEPTRILFRCPFHGSICLVDGSVQMEVAKKHPEQIVQRDGKLYFANSINENALPSQPVEQNQ